MFSHLFCLFFRTFSTSVKLPSQNYFNVFVLTVSALFSSQIQSPFLHFFVNLTKGMFKSVTFVSSLKLFTIISLFYIARIQSRTHFCLHVSYTLPLLRSHRRLLSHLTFLLCLYDSLELANRKFYLIRNVLHLEGKVEGWERERRRE